MKVTFSKNNIYFNFEFDHDKFGEGMFIIKYVTCEDLEIIDVQLELDDVHVIQQAGEIEIEYIMNPEEWDLLEMEVKKQILSDPVRFDVHSHVSEDDEWLWYEYRQQEIQRAYEDKL